MTQYIISTPRVNWHLGLYIHNYFRMFNYTPNRQMLLSHLACHTYPEHQTATFNLYCCKARPEWDWDAKLRTALAATSVSVAKIDRGESLRFETAGGER